MKLTHFFTLVAIFIFSATSAIFAQDNGKKTVSFATSAMCEMCKEKIEKGLMKNKAIEKAELNLADKTVTVVYDDKKVSEEKIKAIVAKTGYDAGDVKANPGAYKKLPKCCKKSM